MSSAVDERLTEIVGDPDCQRKLSLNLMERIEPREVAHLPIAHRDRPSRFGCDWFRALCQAAWLHPHRCQPGRPVAAGRSRMRPMARAKPAKVTRILHSQGLEPCDLRLCLPRPYSFPVCPGGFPRVGRPGQG